MKRYFYIGDTSFLLKNKYQYLSAHKINYYAKRISYDRNNGQVNLILNCYINLKTKEITFSGDMSLKKYFEKELEGKFEVKEVN